MSRNLKTDILNLVKNFTKKFRRILKKLVHNPWIDFSVGGILLLTGMWEAWETIPQDLANSNFRTAHGVIVFAVVAILRSVAEMFGGLEFMDEAEYIEQEKRKN